MYFGVESSMMMFAPLVSTLDAVAMERSDVVLVVVYWIQCKPLDGVTTPVGLTSKKTKLFEIERMWLVRSSSPTVPLLRASIRKSASKLINVDSRLSLCTDMPAGRTP